MKPSMRSRASETTFGASSRSTPTALKQLRQRDEAEQLGQRGTQEGGGVEVAGGRAGQVADHSLGP